MLSLEQARALERLTIGSQSSAPTASASGIRHARVRGRGVEFHDFRRYQPGDDPRSIDWNVEARLRQLVVRVSRADGHLPVHLLVDTSASMGVGTPDKLQAATRLAAALAYVAVLRRDPVGIATFDATVRANFPPAPGRMQIHRIYETLRSLQATGRSNVTQALTDYGTAARGGGLAIVLSDFFDQAGPFAGLRYLLHCGLTPVVIHCVASVDTDPAVDDEADAVDLVDVEDRSGRILTVDAAAVAEYRKNLQRESSALAEFCSAHGMPWMRLSASDAYDRVLDACIRIGLLGTHR